MKRRNLVISSVALLALLDLNACTSDKDYVRNRYSSLEDCLKDYSKEDCEQQKDASKTTPVYNNGHVVYMPYGYYYYGPWYHYTYFGTSYSGRTSIGQQYSTTATHIVNSEGAAIARSGFSSIAASKSGASGFARGGFGATAKGFSIGA